MTASARAGEPLISYSVRWSSNSMTIVPPLIRQSPRAMGVTSASNACTGSGAAMTSAGAVMSSISASISQAST